MRRTDAFVRRRCSRTRHDKSLSGRPASHRVGSVLRPYSPVILPIARNCHDLRLRSCGKVVFRWVAEGCVIIDLQHISGRPRYRVPAYCDGCGREILRNRSGVWWCWCERRRGGERWLWNLRNDFNAGRKLRCVALRVGGRSGNKIAEGYVRVCVQRHVGCPQMIGGVGVVSEIGFTFTVTG